MNSWTSPVDIRPDDLAIVQEILRAHLPVGFEVWVFGSRANWTTKDSSDLDLAVEGAAKLAHKAMVGLEVAFEESDLPYTVDVVDLKAVSSGFRQIVEDQRLSLPLHDQAGKDEWETTSWGDLATLEYGKSLRGYESSEGPYRVYGTNGPIGWCNEPLCFHPNVIIGRKGAYRGVHYSATPFFVIDTAFYLRPKVEIDTRWAYYQLLTQDINGMDSGSAIPSTSREDFYGLPVKVPSLAEQRAIAHILGTLDDKIELNRRMNRTLEEMARAVFKDWFVDFGPTRAKMEGLDPYLPPELWDLFPDELVDSELGGIPRGWNIKKLGEICTLRAGSTFPKAKQGSRLGTYPFAKVSDMNLAGNSLAILKAANWVGDEDLPQLKAKPLPEGTTVFAKIGEALKQNRLRITLQPTLIDNNMMGAIPDTEVIDHITLFRSLSRFDFGELSGGTALPYLTQKDLSALMIPLPPTDGQRIMSRHIQTLHEKAITNEREAISLLDIRDMLLPKLISGKLLVGPGPRNANWRPQQPPSFSGSILTPTWRQKNGK